MMAQQAEKPFTKPPPESGEVFVGARLRQFDEGREVYMKADPCKDKVFCKHCKYVRDALNTSISETNCAYPDNVEGGKNVDTSDFYRCENSWRITYHNTANNINVDNTCQWYSPDLTAGFVGLGLVCIGIVIVVLYAFSGGCST